MNKLELEMLTWRLNYYKELRESKIKMIEDAILLNRIAAVVSIVAAICCISCSVNCITSSDWFLGTLMILLVALNAVLGIKNIKSVRENKTELKIEKEVFNRISSELEKLSDATIKARRSKV